MVKKIIVLLLFLLSGCKNERIYYCLKDNNDYHFEVSLYAEYDALTQVKIEKSFKLPLEFEDVFYPDDYLLNDHFLSSFEEYNVSDHSLRKTVSFFRSNYFYCEEYR